MLLTDFENEVEKLAEKRNNERLAQIEAQKASDEFYRAEMRDQAAADAAKLKSQQDLYEKIGSLRPKSQFGAPSGFESMGASMGGASVLPSLRAADHQVQLLTQIRDLMKSDRQSNIERGRSLAGELPTT